MGSCMSRENQISQIETEMQMLNSESRIRNEFLLREISILKQMLQTKNFDDNRRYSYHPVTQNQIKYV